MEVKIETYPKVLDAQNAAIAEHAATNNRIVPGIMFRQRGVWMVSTVFSMGDIINLTQVQSIDRESGDAMSGFNRPEETWHTNEIAEYFNESEQYICPTLTLNLLAAPKIFSTETDSAWRQMWMILPRGYRFQIADGQHRVKAIEKVLEERPEMEDDGVGVQIILEDDIDRVHQYFADCSKSLSISPSLTQVWDGNYILNKLSKRVRAEIPFFANNLETARTKVTTKSKRPFTVAQVNAAFAECICFRAEEKQSASKSALSREFLRHGAEQLTEDVEFVFKTFADHNQQWMDFAEGTEDEKVVELREKYLHFNRIGLRLVGRIGYSILRTVEDPARQEELMIKFATMDFHRQAEFWRRHGVTNDRGAILGSYAPIRHATEAIEEYLGIGGLREKYERNLKIQLRAERSRDKNTMTVKSAITRASTLKETQKILNTLMGQNGPVKRSRRQSSGSKVYA